MAEYPIQKTLNGVFDGIKVVHTANSIIMSIDIPAGIVAELVERKLVGVCTGTTLIVRYELTEIRRMQMRQARLVNRLFVDWNNWLTGSFANELIFELKLLPPLSVQFYSEISVNNKMKSKICKLEIVGDSPRDIQVGSYDEAMKRAVKASTVPDRSFIELKFACHFGVDREVFPRFLIDDELPVGLRLFESGARIENFNKEFVRVGTCSITTSATGFEDYYGALAEKLEWELLEITDEKDLSRALKSLKSSAERDFQSGYFARSVVKFIVYSINRVRRRGEIDPSIELLLCKMRAAMNFLGDREWRQIREQMYRYEKWQGSRFCDREIVARLKKVMYES